MRNSSFRLAKVIHSLTLVLALPLSVHVNAQEPSAGLSEGEWYVRLVVANESEGLSDRGNVLGQLHASASGKDTHDLRELNPHSSPYLSVVFNKADWGSDAGNYSSDYRGTNAAGAIWEFEVRSDDVNREVTLGWDSSDRHKLLQSRLIDKKTGEEIRIAEMGISSSRLIVAPLQYVFNMEGESIRRFRWEVNTDRGRSVSKYQGPQRRNSGSIQKVSASNSLPETEGIEILPQVMRTNYYLGQPPLTN